MTTGSLVFPKQKNDPTVERGIRFANVSSRPGGVTVDRASSVQQIISLPISDESDVHSGAVRYRRSKIPLTILADEYRNRDEFGNVIYSFTGPLLVVAASSSVEPGGHVLDANAVFLWRFDETTSSEDAVDEAGHTNLQSIGPNGPEVVSGKIDWARISSERNYFQASGSALSRDTFNGDWTVEMWVKPVPGISDSQYLFLYSGMNAASDIHGAGILSSLHYSDGGDGNRRFYCSFQDAAGGSVNTFYTLGDFSSREWRHVALSRKLNLTYYIYKLYVDGILDNVQSTEGQSLITQSLDNTSRFITVGNSLSGSEIASSTHDPFFGKLDDVRVSNIARSDAEILESYVRGAAVHSTSESLGHIFDANTVTLWRFDEAASSDDPVDVAGNTELQQFGPTGPPVISGLIDGARQINSGNFFQGIGNAVLGNTLNGNWTVELWMNPASGSNNEQTLIFYGGHDFTTDPVNEGIMMSLTYLGDASKDVSFTYQLLDGTLVSVSGTAPPPDTEGYSPIAHNSWNHIALSRYETEPDVFEYAVHVNGYETGISTNPGDVLVSPTGSAATHFITVGNYVHDVDFGSNPQALFSGSIDDVRISNVKRTHNEIVQSYERGKGL